MCHVVIFACLLCQFQSLKHFQNFTFNESQKDSFNMLLSIIWTLPVCLVISIEVIFVIDLFLYNYTWSCTIISSWMWLSLSLQEIIRLSLPLLKISYETEPSLELGFWWLCVIMVGVFIHLFRATSY